MLAKIFIRPLEMGLGYWLWHSTQFNVKQFNFILANDGIYTFNKVRDVNAGHQRSVRKIRHE